MEKINKSVVLKLNYKCRINVLYKQWLVLKKP